MELSGDCLIAATRDAVWAALNDPEVLKACIPGCKTLEKSGDDRFEAVAELKIGPVQARFSGVITLSDIEAPHRYTLNGEGRGVAGFAKGDARVTLQEAAAGTLLTYTVHANVGGKLAQLGGRLIDATAKKLAEAFFAQFVAQVTPPQQQPVAATTAAADDDDPNATASVGYPPILGLHPLVWTVGLAALAIALMVVFSSGG